MKFTLSLLMGAEYSLLNGLLKAIENGIVIVAGILCHLMFASKKFLHCNQRTEGKMF